MIEDKLDQDQRIRLECLAQANSVRGHAETAESVVERATRYESYVREGKN